jgi:hypothetical protein
VARVDALGDLPVEPVNVALLADCRRHAYPQIHHATKAQNGSMIA